MKVLVLMFLAALVVSPAESRMVVNFRHPKEGVKRTSGAAGVGGAPARVARVFPYAPPAPKANDRPEFPPGL
ncbi:unnamed protein product [Spirodela intermedia]|uniref:Uncharacterized protein n=2 Tax=Spirodela intermedia TaxID=51605 RepID=A0A7I8KWL0_SPIIN|nr:unnamed protein product [Spirodela intermedia]CAA6665459.1 unnamed protein product [Spirodela intermedia]CAA7402197.1 unnamed protein product [Spirodela intermedia]